MKAPHPINRLSHTLLSLEEPMEALLGEALSAAERQEIINAGVLRPGQNDALSAWYARFVSARNELLAIIHAIDEQVDTPLNALHTLAHWRCFVVAYASACWLVRLDRFLLFEFATDPLIQRKLNEPFTEFRIPKKQFTAVFDHFTNPLLALKLNELMRLARTRRRSIQALEDDALVGSLVRSLPRYEGWLDASKLNFVKRSLAYVQHSLRRRGARAKQRSTFAVLEGVGRTASELNLNRQKVITDRIRSTVAALLEPGDVLITRHRYALTNLFLPGVWPHAALYVGTPEQRNALGIDQPVAAMADWRDDICTFEALKDGVRLRPLSDTLAVDGFVVLRPVLSQELRKAGIERVLVHKDKGYNFDFDFFRSDRLVCTEVIYRAFDGLGAMDFPLQTRAGRQTLSAEDFLDLAMDTDQFYVVAACGVPSGSDTLLRGDAAALAIRNSYRNVDGVGPR